MTKLSDMQAVLLSSASQRTTGSLLPLPTSLVDTPRIGKSLAGLLTRGLAEERPTDIADAVHRVDGDLRFGLFITTAGEAAIGLDTTGTAADPAAPSKSAAAPAATPPAPLSPRQTKAELVLALLRRDGGATMPDLITATGWLPHTTRAALTGLRKKGHDVVRGKRGDATCYSVPAAPAGAGDAADVADAR